MNIQGQDRQQCPYSTKVDLFCKKLYNWNYKATCSPLSSVCRFASVLITYKVWYTYSNHSFFFLESHPLRANETLFRTIWCPSHYYWRRLLRNTLWTAQEPYDYHVWHSNTAYSIWSALMPLAVMKHEVPKRREHWKSSRIVKYRSLLYSPTIPSENQEAARGLLVVR